MEENKSLQTIKEERKQVARTRVFYTLLVLSLALLIYLVVEILILVG